MWSLSAAVCAEKLAQQSPAKVGCSRRKTVKRGKGTNGTLPRDGTEHFVRTVHTGKHHALTSPRPPIGFIQVRPASASVRHNTLREYQGLQSRRPGRYKSTGPFCFCGLVLGRFLSGCRTLHHMDPFPRFFNHVTERESKSERGREGEEHEATVLRAQLVRSSQTTPSQQDKTLVDERTQQLETSMQVLLTAMTMARGQ